MLKKIEAILPKEGKYIKSIKDEFGLIDVKEVNATIKGRNETLKEVKSLLPQIIEVIAKELEGEIVGLSYRYFNLEKREQRFKQHEFEKEVKSLIKKLIK